jgi:hypothetical protein
LPVAILSERNYTREKLNDLKETVIKVHDILQELDKGTVKLLLNPHQSRDTGDVNDRSKN